MMSQNEITSHLLTTLSLSHLLTSIDCVFSQLMSSAAAAEEASAAPTPCPSPRKKPRSTPASSEKFKVKDVQGLEMKSPTAAPGGVKVKIEPNGASSKKDVTGRRKEKTTKVAVQVDADSCVSGPGAGSIIIDLSGPGEVPVVTVTPKTRAPQVARGNGRSMVIGGGAVCRGLGSNVVRVERPAGKGGVKRPALSMNHGPEVDGSGTAAPSPCATPPNVPGKAPGARHFPYDAKFVKPHDHVSRVTVTPGPVGPGTTSLSTNDTSATTNGLAGGGPGMQMIKVSVRL